MINASIDNYTEAEAQALLKLMNACVGALTPTCEAAKGVCKNCKYVHLCGDLTSLAVCAHRQANCK